ncbi:MAG: GNAT family N-acetyltransferase [Anaerolineae bacterium]|nr:GNAT family N-acetyltransferase [Thermoflexales bacterium]MDW8053787.1 GNAT family N-acetyltransferase [Anaerolineae bacterium]
MMDGALDQRLRLPLMEALQLCDEELELTLADATLLNERDERVPTYRFHMQVRGSRTIAGEISLRIGSSPNLVVYYGHIGYHVEPPYRGRRFAARSCRLLLPLARAHGMDELWITCNPDNWASRRTCELAGGVLVDIVDIPPTHPLYRRGERQKCRYRFELRGIAAYELIC